MGRGRPRKTDQINIMVRLPKDLRQRAEAIAESEQRTVNNWIATLVHKAVEKNPNAIL